MAEHFIGFAHNTKKQGTTRTFTAISFTRSSVFLAVQHEFGPIFIRIDCNSSVLNTTTVRNQSRRSERNARSGRARRKLNRSKHAKQRKEWNATWWQMAHKYESYKKSALLTEIQTTRWISIYFAISFFQKLIQRITAFHVISIIF